MSENNKATFDCDLPSIDGPISHREALALYAQENVALRAEIAALNEQIAQLMAESEHRAKYESEIAALRAAVRFATAFLIPFEDTLLPGWHDHPAVRRALQENP